MKVTKKGEKRRWDPTVTAAELVRENRKAKQGRKDETERGWTKDVKRVTTTGVKQWRPGTRDLQEIRFYQKSTVLLIPVRVFCHLVREIGQNIKANIGGNPLPSSPYKMGLRLGYLMMLTYVQYMHGGKQ